MNVLFPLSESGAYFLLPPCRWIDFTTLQDRGEKPHARNNIKKRTKKKSSNVSRPAPRLEIKPTHHTSRSALMHRHSYLSGVNSRPLYSHESMHHARMTCMIGPKFHLLLGHRYEN